MQSRIGALKQELDGWVAQQRLTHPSLPYPPHGYAVSEGITDTAYSSDQATSSPTTTTTTGNGNTHITVTVYQTYTIAVTGAAHDQKGVVEHKDATCTEDGVQGGKYCSICGEDKEAAEKKIPALGHNTEGKVEHKDAACTEDGVVGGTYCTRCGEGKAAAEAAVPAKGHEWDGGEVTKAPTLQEKGVKTFSCTVCKATRTQAIPSLIQLITPTPQEAQLEQADISTADDIAKDILVDTIVGSELQAKVDEALKSDPGATVRIVVDIEKLDAASLNDEAQKADIDRIRAAMEPKGSALGGYFDISLLVKVGDAQVGTMTSAKQPLTFALAIPQELQKEGRTFKVLRCHDGVVDELPTTVKDGEAFFQTDRFSVYALAYSDQAIGESAASGSDDGEGAIPRTGDGGAPMLLAALALGGLSAAALAAAAIRRRPER